MCLKKIKYFYNADGVKVKKEVTNASVVTKTDYLTGFQYVNGGMDFFQTPEGYVKVTYSSKSTYTYLLSDAESNFPLFMRVYCLLETIEGHK